jgi:hypothetical protein
MTIGRGGPGMHLVDERGVLDTNGGRWLRSASIEDRGVMARVVGPVLDAGCGPGRHVKALQCLGIEALGIRYDAVGARGRGAMGRRCYRCSTRSPGWGNGRPRCSSTATRASAVTRLAYCCRSRSVLRVDGWVLADLVTGIPRGPRQLRLRHGHRLGPTSGGRLYTSKICERCAASPVSRSSIFGRTGADGFVSWK